MMPALVTTQTDLASPGQHSSRSAWATGTAFYLPLQDQVPLMKVMKSTDGSTWDEQDVAHNILAFQRSPFSSWLHTDGFLYVFYNTGAFYAYRIRRFNTATDLWETSDYTGVDVSLVVNDAASARMVVTPNNELVCFYQNQTTLEPTIRRWDGASWGVETSLEATDGRPLDMLIDGSDRLVLAWEDVTNGAQKYVTIDNLGVLGSIDIFDASVNTTPTVSSLMCRFNDGTNDCLAILSRDTGGEVDCHSGIEGATLGSLTTVDAISTATPVSEYALGLVTFNGQVYACWSVITGPATYVYYAISTSLSPLTFGPEQSFPTTNYTPGVVPQWLIGLNAIGILYKELEESGDNVYVEWLVQPDGYQPWPANDISQIVATATREQQ